MITIDLAINLGITLAMLAAFFSTAFFVEQEHAESYSIKQALMAAILASDYVMQEGGSAEGELAGFGYCSNCGLRGDACVSRKGTLFCAWKLKEQ